MATKTVTAEKAAETVEAVETVHPETATVNIPLIPGQDETMFVSVNEKTYMIRRGEDVEVPLAVKEVIDRSAEAATANFRRQAQLAIG